MVGRNDEKAETKGFSFFKKQDDATTEKSGLFGFIKKVKKLVEKDDSAPLKAKTQVMNDPNVNFQMSMMFGLPDDDLTPVKTNPEDKNVHQEESKEEQ